MSVRPCSRIAPPQSAPLLPARWRIGRLIEIDSLDLSMLQRYLVVSWRECGDYGQAERGRRGGVANWHPVTGFIMRSRS